MKNFLLVLLLILTTCSLSRSQVIVSYEHITDLSSTQVDSIIGDAGPFGVAIYKVVYTMIDHNEKRDTVSGLFGLPLNPTFRTTLVVYNHGTTQGPADAPSNLGSGFSETLAFSSFGFATAAPDYIGLGESDSFHPYVHAESEALSGLYMIAVAYEIMDLENVPNPGSELFIAGYSQGGHASMALQKLIETDFTDDIDITACAHGSGPYSISHVMRNLIIGDEVYLPVGFIPYVILGYQAAYGDLYDSLDEIFKPNYIPRIIDFQNGDLDLTNLSIQLGLGLFFEVGAVIPKYILQDSIVARLEANDPDDQLIRYLRENDVYEFRANTPTRLYYCEADDIVPFENTIFADSAMQILGASDLEAIHVNPNADHGQCAVEAIPLAIDYFLGFLNVGVAYQEAQIVKQSFPNPAVDQLNIVLEEKYNDVKYALFDVTGKIVQQGILQHEYNYIDLNRLMPGFHTVQLIQNNEIQTLRFIKN